MTNNKCATVVNIMGLKETLGPTLNNWLGPRLKPTLHQCSVLANSVLNPVFVFQVRKTASFRCSTGLYACMTYVHTCHT